MTDLAARFAVDIASAGLSAATIAPVIFILDKSIMEATSGKANSIGHSIRSSMSSLLSKPTTFFLSVPFLLLYGVYSSTYIAANVFDTVSNRTASIPRDWAKQTTGFGKFLTTTTINLSASVYKDMRYAKFFGVGQPRSMPLATMMLFGARDSLTVFASFNVPPLLVPMVSLNVAQIVTPCAMQFLSTPMHLLGLDIYNRKDETLLSRIRQVQARYWNSSFARVGRILPAFGIGGVLNREIRTRSMHATHRVLHT